MESGLQVRGLLADQPLIGVERARGVLRTLVGLRQRKEGTAVAGIDRLRPLKLADRVLVASREQVQRAEACSDVGRIGIPFGRGPVDCNGLVVFLLELEKGGQGVGGLEVPGQARDGLAQHGLRIRQASCARVDLPEEERHLAVQRAPPGELRKRLACLLQPAHVVVEFGEGPAGVLIGRVRLQGGAVLFDRQGDLGV